MRIAVVGDLQYRKGEDITEIAQDISALEADTVIIVGDYGYWDGFGSYEVFSDIENAFRKVKCRQFLPLLGNHDVQFEAGEVYMKKGTVAANYQQAFGQAPENRLLDFGSFQILCIHMEPQPKEDFCFLYECYVSDAHIEEIRRMLRENDKPTIIIAHAPPVGTDLLTVPMTHVRAANAYMNQDHGYEKFRDLTREFRQIILWFSGHYHIGHSYPDSMAIRDDLAYFVTGSASSGTRDGLRHTRIIEEKDGVLTVLTYDHDLKRILPEPDYCCPAQKRGELQLKPRKRFSAGCGKILMDGLKFGANGRVYAMTDNNILWEIDIVDGFAAGAIHYSDKYHLDGFAVDEEYIWRFCGDKAFGHRYSDLHRFMREKDLEDCRFIERERSSVRTTEPSDTVFRSRASCRVSDTQICTAYNDGNGKLWFELIDL